MKKIALLSLLSACWLTVHASFTPVVLTGFNVDIIANGSAAAASTISSSIPEGFDGVGYTLVAQDYSYAGYTPLSTYYLPTGGSITSAVSGLNFQLADYSSNNALRLVASGDAGTLTLATPQSAGALYLCGLSGSGISTFDITINFSDATTQTISSLSFPDWYASGGTLAGIGRVSTTDNHTEGTATAPSLFEIAVNLDPANYAKLITSISVSKTSTTGVLGLMAMSAEDICSGTPSAGAVAATVTSGCSAFTSMLSLPTSTSSAAINYQWQSSADGLSWTDVSGATDATYTAAVSATVYYRAYLICTTTGGDSDTSSSAELVLTSPSPVVATLPFNESFENWIGACYSFDRPGVNWLTSPPSGNNSWRRDDEGSDASWGDLTSGGYSPVSTVGSHSARFHSYFADLTSGNMDLYIDLSTPGTKQISFDYNNADGTDDLEVQLSEDGGATFTTLGDYLTTSGWATQILTTTSVASNAVIRFLANSDYGNTDIGLDNLSVIALTDCSGTPVAGTTTATQYTGCSAFTSTVSLPISTVGGLTYQWQSSTDDATWTSLAGATDYTFTTYVTGPVYFRAFVVCTASSGSDTSAAVFLNVVIPTATVATLPFNESFENWIGGCYMHDRPGVNWLNNPSSGNDSWRREDQGSDASWGAVTAGLYTPVSTNGAHSARFHSYLGFSEGDMDLYLDLSPAGTKQISFDYTNASGSDNLAVELSEDGGLTFTTLGTYNTTSGWSTNVLTTTSVAANAIIRFAATGDDGSTDIGLDNISIVTLAGCTGTPVAGTITATQYSGCSAFTATVSLPISSIGGLTYQWQSSADSSAWSDIPGATDFTYATYVTANTYYRVYVTCTASSASDTTAGVLLQIVTPTATTATVPFFESFENWIGTCYTADRPGANWLTNPSSGNDAWRRDDQGSDASWGIPGSYMYSPESTDGAHSARFHSGEASGSSTGNMDLYIDLSTAGTKLINFDYINNSGSDHLTVQLSEDGGTTFSTLGTFISTSGWTSEQVTTNSIAANAVIRLLGTADFGTTDIGIDSFSVSIAPSCSGVPTAGTFTSSNTSGCTPYTSNLSVDAPIFLTGIGYQWQSSTDGVSFSDVPGASTTTYAASVSSDIYYRFYVTCAASSSADTSAATELFYVPVVPVAATVPYFQGFESWTNGCYSFDRPDASWSNTPTHGDNSWRRDDQGSDAGWDFLGSYMYSPASTEGSHSARFHSGYTMAGIEGDMNLYIDLSTPGTKLINFDYINLNGSDHMNVELSEDGGTTFTTLGTIGTTSGWVAQSITTTSVASNAIIRFAGIADYGSTDIGIDSLSITVEAGCTGTPVAGTFSSTETSGCTAYTSNLSVDAPILLTGISYQWQSSGDGATFTNVSGATTTNYTASVTANIYYRFYVACSGSGDGDTSAATELLYSPVVPVYAALPYTQGFENWIAGCYSFDRPDGSWVNTPTTGNNSWRRDDQGSDASWDSPTGGSYSPASTEGAHSARFHSYEADFGDVGTLDLYVDLSAPGTKQILFDYNNDNSDFGSDELDVQLSEDGGATFTTLGSYPEVSGWVPEVLTTTSTAAHAILRFSATSDFGNTDIGVDSLYIGVVPVAAPCDTPTALTVTGISSTSATVSWTGVTGAAGYQYVINTTAADPIGPGTATTATAVTDGSLTASTIYYAHVRTECGGGDSSIWVTVTFTTSPAPIPCDAAIGLTAASITDSSAVLSWSAVTGATGYQYVIDNSASAPTGSGTATTDTVYSDTSLACNTTYYLHVRTDCSTDSAAWSTITFTTDTCSNEGVHNVQINSFVLEAYPNPTKDVVNVEIKGIVSGNPAVQLTDVTGKVIQIITLSANKAQIDMSAVTPGIYFLNYSDNINRRTIKINKQ